MGVDAVPKVPVKCGRPLDGHYAVHMERVPKPRSPGGVRRTRGACKDRRRDARPLSYLHPYMPLTSDQFASALLALLRQQPSAGAGAEQRREPRISVTGLVVLTADGSDVPPIHARLKDISRGGVGFTHHSGLPKGRRMILHLPSSEGQPRSVPCEVRHCTLVRDELYLIGVAFPEDATTSASA